MSTPSPSRLSRTLGALLGVHAGDSLGATLEFTTWSRIITRYPQGLRDIIGGGPFDWEPGHATDDTDLTRAVLLAYHDREKGKNKAEFDVVKASADYSLKWLNGDWPDRRPGSWPNDIGGATQKGLLNYQLSRNPVTCGAGPGSAGNGSLMRCIPTALFAHEKEQRIKESKAISAFTHNDVRCTISCAVYNEIVAALIQGKTPREAVEIGRAVAKELECRAVEEAIAKGEGMSILQKAAEGPGNELPDHTSGYVLQSLTVAVAALLDQRSLEDVLVDVVRLGGDTDTNGAISGGLLGARDGIEGIPERWLEVLQFRKEFEEVSKSILSSQGLL